MRNLFYTIFILFITTGYSQFNNQELKKLSDSICPCISKISLYTSKKSKSDEISKCISGAILTKNMVKSLTKIKNNTIDSLKNIKNLSKIDSIKMDNDIMVGASDEQYKQVEKYIFENCKNLKKIYFTDNTKFKNSYSDKKKATKFYDKGLTAFQRQDYKTALPLFKKAVSKDSKFAFAWDNLGYTYRKLGNYKKAIEAYQKSLALDPKGKMPLMNIAVAYQLNNDLKNAIKSYLTYGSYYKDDPEVYYGLGRIYYLQKNYEPALDNMIRAYTLYTKMKSPYSNDAAKHINFIYNELKKQGKLNVFYKLAKKHNLNISKN